MDPKQQLNNNSGGQLVSDIKPPPSTQQSQSPVQSPQQQVSQPQNQATQQSGANVAKSAPMTKSKIEKPSPKAKGSGVSWLRDFMGLGIFVVVVLVGAFLINTFIFRSFNVVGPSMEPTLDGGYGGLPNDRLIINLMPRTWAGIWGGNWVPERGDIVVFHNPSWRAGEEDEYVVKRVIGLPGERVTVNDCVLKVYNEENPDGFDPYPTFENMEEDDKKVNTCVAGNGTDRTVSEDSIFVVGDHRVDNYSMDSRNGDGRASLGLVPLKNIVGKVAVRIWPFDRFKFF
ncbi:MAG: signal peptidase I [Candidatus Nomurabacteria bacterium]|jgi:signal peptidase I|nr:signal peptidase I [Candidatus Nomurabacteria bacterium]